MNPLSHAMPAWWPWVAVVWLVLVIALGITFIRRPHPRFAIGTRIWLWLVRAVASAALLALILNWSTETTRQTAETPMIRILTDRSASMAAKDAPDGSSRHDSALKAAVTIAGITPHSAQSSFSADLEPDGTSTVPDGQRSAIGQALFRTLDESRQQALGGVVVLSDFAASDEDVIKETLQLYQSAKVPVFTWPIGTSKQPADLRLVSAQLTQPSPSQPNLRLTATVESPGYADQDATLAISSSGQSLFTQTLHLNGTRQNISIDFPSPFRGLHFYDIHLAEMAGEATLANNTLRSACELRRD